MVPFVILWTIWIERSDRIFKDASSFMQALLSAATLRITKRVSIWKEFTNRKELGGPIVRGLSFTVGEGKAGSAAGLPSIFPLLCHSITRSCRSPHHKQTKNLKLLSFFERARPHLKASMVCGPSKERKRMLQTTLQLEVLKYNVNRAARGKAIPIGIRKVLRNDI